MLIAPFTDFERELQRMKMIPSRFQAWATQHETNNWSFAEQSARAEVSDLAMALKKTGKSPEEIDRIRDLHNAERQKLKKYLDDVAAWEASGVWEWDTNGRHQKPKGDRPKFPKFEFVDGLPAEFADYFEGAIAWANPALEDKQAAREAWERVLARPSAERKFKSTWAAFMLGKAAEEESPEKAMEYYQKVRDFAGHGFADSMGLAAASLGLEAKVHYAQEEYLPAFHIYLDQFATGDPTAATSLLLVAQKLVGDPDALVELAKDARARWVITAFLISRQNSFEEPRKEVTNWLAAVESVGAVNLESAEQLALAAYQAGSFDVAQRWINRSKSSPVSQWLQAKLYLRAGKIEQAASLLAKISDAFPLETGTNAPTSLAENLSVGNGALSPIPAGRQALGEIGVLHLARREYVQALDALLRSGFWLDAAYVAERVLTVEELKEYVDREWPALDAKEEPEPNPNNHDAEFSLPHMGSNVRYLLARRLTRLDRGQEAEAYFPAEWRSQFATLQQSLRTGWDEGQSAEVRAKALFFAATIARTNGMELLGTEVDPDWAITGGGFEESLTADLRSPTNENFKILPASVDEIRRYHQHDPEPNERFHYRYQAAALAWEAAKLMPDNSDETARVLCTGGSWLKYRDPEAADLFYKALVRRCRKTAIGDQADKMRWFPVLDENGNPKPYPPGKTSTPVEESATPAADSEDTDAGGRSLSGDKYVIRSGDTLAAIAKAATALGRPVSVQDIIAANPELSSMRLSVGQVIIIPPARETTAEKTGSAQPQEPPN